MPHIWHPERKPTTEQFLHGLQAIEDDLTQKQRSILREQYWAPQHRIRAGVLAEFCGLKGHAGVNSCYTAAARRFCEVAGFRPTLKSNGRPEWWCVWSFGIPLPKGRYEWQMHEELINAIRQLQWFGEDRRYYLTDVVDAPPACLEGRTRQVTVNAVERSPAVRARCIRIHGTACTICGFDFGATFGAIGKGFIHVHHLQPLGDGHGARPVDPERDVIPVCPNCHAMLHQRRPPLEPETLRRILANREKS